MTTKKTTLEKVTEVAKNGTEPAEEQVEQPDAVVVHKVVDEDGNITTEVSIVGSVQPTEVQTLLELATLGWRARIGLKA
jgi:hypothetical protein